MKLQCIRQLFSLFLPTKAIPTIYLQTANHFCVFSIHIQRRKMRRKENERKVSSQAKCAKFSAKSEPKSKKFECWCPRTYNCPSLQSSAAILSDWGPQIWPPFYMAMPPPSPPPTLVGVRWMCEHGMTAGRDGHSPLALARGQTGINSVLAPNILHSGLNLGTNNWLY